MADEPMADLVGAPWREFKLREQIGEDGRAVVYRCEQPALQRVDAGGEQALQVAALLEAEGREAGRGNGAMSEIG